MPDPTSRPGGPIDVVLAADARFSVPLAVVIASLAEANRNQSGGPDHYRVTIFAENFPAKVRDLVRAAGDEHLSVAWHIFDNADLKDLPTMHLSTAAYYRLLAPALLPDAERIVYLDADVLVNTGLAPLARTDLGDAVAGAVQNLNVPFLASRNGLDSWDDLGLDPVAPYFNSGVLVMDRQRWVDQRITERVLDLVRSGAESARFVDQGPLNAVLAGDWRELDHRWNQHPLVYARNSGLGTFLDRDIIDQVRADPWIIHFVGPVKPWHSASTHPWTDQWRTFARDLVGSAWRPDRRNRSTTPILRLKKATHAFIQG